MHAIGARGGGCDTPSGRVCARRVARRCRPCYDSPPRAHGRTLMRGRCAVRRPRQNSRVRARALRFACTSLLRHERSVRNHVLARRQPGTTLCRTIYCCVSLCVRIAARGPRVRGAAEMGEKSRRVSTFVGTHTLPRPPRKEGTITHQPHAPVAGRRGGRAPFTDRGHDKIATPAPL